MNNISIFSKFTKFMGNKPLTTILDEIVSGVYDIPIQKIRQLIALGKTTEAEEEKKKLPAFTPSGIFDKGRKANLLQQYSKYVILDIDDLEDEKLDPVFNQACNLTTTLSCFKSPSGKGLKVIVEVTSDAEHHEQAFNQVADHYEKYLQVKIDHSGKDVSRLCFYSSDPLLYRNDDNVPFQITVKEALPAAEVMSAVKPAADFTTMYIHAVEFTQNKITYEEGSRNRFVHLLASNCNRNGIPEQTALDYILQDFNYDDKEVSSSVRSAYKNHAEFGKFAQLAQTALSEVDNSEEAAMDEFHEKLLTTPFIPDSVYRNLPSILQRACAHFEHPREKDLFLTGALTVLGGCMKGVEGNYDQRRMFSNLFCFIIAPPASGKNALAFAKDLGMIHHRDMVKESKELMKQYLQELQQFHASKGSKKGQNKCASEPPEKPGFNVLFIPANSSSAAVIGHLEQSGGIGIILETESDTMANNFKQDWGGYSDMLRKAFHHEPVTYSRKTNNEFIEVDCPRISVALAGTPSMVQSLIKSAEDGLFSRFIYYIFRVPSKWRDVSPQKEENLNEAFAKLSEEVDLMAITLGKTQTRIHLSKGQWELLNKKFGVWLDEVTNFVGEDASSTVKRLGLIVFRIAMVITAIRKFENGSSEQDITCEDTDFETAFALAEVYKEHALLLFSYLPKSLESKVDLNMKRLFEVLPNETEFTRQHAVELGKAIDIKERTVGKYLGLLLRNKFLEQPVKYGPYRKTS